MSCMSGVGHVRRDNGGGDDMGSVLAGAGSAANTEASRKKGHSPAILHLFAIIPNLKATAANSMAT